jgi:enamine deaminase RidA (YjgF/YER057c/UK114 family)
MQRKLISTGSVFEQEIGYSRAVVAGNMVFVSGCTGFNYVTNTVSDNILEQAEQTFQNIIAALEQAGSSLKDVVRVTYVTTKGEDFEACTPIFKKYFGDIRPAAMALCANFPNPNILIEIEVTAVKG